MRAIRRLLRVVAFVGTLLVGIVALSLIVSQTPWFRDWIRRYIVRESKQYLNGELTIGSLGGNLLFGVDLADVAVDVSGERIVAVKALSVDYSVFELVSTGIVLDEIKIDRPVVRLDPRRERLEPRAARQTGAEGSQPRRAAPHDLPAGHPGGRRERVDRRSHAPLDVQAPEPDRRAQREGRVRVRAGALHGHARSAQLPRYGAGPHDGAADRQDCRSGRQPVPRRDRVQDDARRR